MPAMKRRGERGSAAVEAALLLGVWAALILGIAEIGRAWFSYNLLSHAVREAARMAAVRPALQPDDPFILSRIDLALALGNLSASKREVIFTQPLKSTRLIRVLAQVDYVPAVGRLWSDPPALVIPMKAEHQTQYEL